MSCLPFTRRRTTSGSIGVSASGPYTTAPGFSVTTGICGTTSIVTQPLSSNAATSELPATSSSVLNPCVTLPTLQLPWSSATVPNVFSAAFIQNTQPAGTRPVRPSAVGAAIGSSNIGTPSSGASENGIASGGGARGGGAGGAGARAGESPGGGCRRARPRGRASPALSWRAAYRRRPALLPELPQQSDDDGQG